MYKNKSPLERLLVSKDNNKANFAKVDYLFYLLPLFLSCLKELVLIEKFATHLLLEDLILLSTCVSKEVISL